jgi:hypothetical protein
MEIVPPRFKKINSEYIESIKIAHPITISWLHNFPHCTETSQLILVWRQYKPRWPNYDMLLVGRQFYTDKTTLHVTHLQNA